MTNRQELKYQLKNFYFNFFKVLKVLLVVFLVFMVYQFVSAHLRLREAQQKLNEINQITEQFKNNIESQEGHLAKKHDEKSLGKSHKLWLGKGERNQLEQNKKIYTVQPGDSTWKIAEKFYVDGSKYVLLEKANNLQSDQWLDVNQELFIPAVLNAGETNNQQSKAAIEKTPKSSAQHDQAHLVVRDDSLWNIAEEQLGDPYLWPELYEANKQIIGNNPDLIYPGMVLSLEIPQTKNAGLVHR